MFYFNEEKKKFEDEPAKLKDEAPIDKHEDAEEIKEPLFFKIVSVNEKKAIEKLRLYEEQQAKIEQRETQAAATDESAKNMSPFKRPAESAR